MDKNLKFLFGAVAVILVAQEIRFRKFAKHVSNFAETTIDYFENELQREVDAEFEEIVEQYDDP